jgi:hypothetical protein
MLTQSMPIKFIATGATSSFAKNMASVCPGRPPSKIEERKAAHKQVRQDELDRIPIEG